MSKWDYIVEEMRLEDGSEGLTEDEIYMAAVERGDMETAARMVAEAAKRAMPNTKITDDAGNPKIVYKGGVKKGLNVFDWGHWANSFFVSDKDIADGFTSKFEFHNQGTFGYYINMERPLVFDCHGDEFAYIPIDMELARKFGIVDGAKHHWQYHEWMQGERNAESEKTGIGYYPSELVAQQIHKANISGDLPYDGIIFHDVREGAENPDAPLSNPTDDILPSFGSSQIKSADPVTRDDRGNIIPLSKRFDPDTFDSRY